MATVTIQAPLEPLLNSDFNAERCSAGDVGGRSPDTMTQPAPEPPPPTVLPNTGGEVSRLPLRSLLRNVVRRFEQPERSVSCFGR